MLLAFFVDRFDPFLGPHHGPLGIHKYGLCYILGFLAGWWLLRRYAQAGRSLLSADRALDCIVAMAVGVYVGGRLGYMLLYDWEDFHRAPWIIFRIWDGGMASHGGMIGVALAIAWFARRHRLPYFHLGDLIVSATPPGLFFVRVANFINGELWGKVSYVRWAVIFPKSDPDAPLAAVAPRHPSQLYEAGLEGLLLFAFIQLRFWKSDAIRTRPGRLSGEFLAAYAVLRIFGERFREPDAGLIAGLSRGTFYSVILFVIGVAIAVACSRPRPLPLPGKP